MDINKKREEEGVSRDISNGTDRDTPEESSVIDEGQRKKIPAEHAPKIKQELEENRKRVTMYLSWLKGEV